jgi:polysaccharide export outer membrane protein
LKLHFSNKHHFLWYLLIPVLFASCTPQKRLTYFQVKGENKDSIVMDTVYTILIQPNDILSIYVASISEDAGKIFNYTSNDNNGTSDASGYVVDQNGNIQMPLVGDVRVAGLTTPQARDTVNKRLSKYLVNPSVKLNIRNFRVTILGEVGKPGVYPVTNEKITLTEALAMAGDLTAYSLRENIMIVREKDGKKEFGHVDISSRDFFASSYFNLKTNDIVYVEAARRKRIFTENFSKVISWITVPASAVYLIYRITQNK